VRIKRYPSILKRISQEQRCPKRGRILDLGSTEDRLAKIIIGKIRKRKEAVRGSTCSKRGRSKRS